MPQDMGNFAPAPEKWSKHLGSLGKYFLILYLAFSQSNRPSSGADFEFQYLEPANTTLNGKVKLLSRV